MNASRTLALILVAGVRRLRKSTSPPKTPSLDGHATQRDCLPARVVINFDRYTGKQGFGHTLPEECNPAYVFQDAKDDPPGEPQDQVRREAGIVHQCGAIVLNEQQGDAATIAPAATREDAPRTT